MASVCTCVHTCTYVCDGVSEYVEEQEAMNELIYSWKW